jgi:hypothetical protein
MAWGVMLMSGDIPSGSLCTSDEVSELIEELQYTLGEGRRPQARAQLVTSALVKRAQAIEPKITM